MELKINNQYILLEKTDSYVFKALINDVTKTSIQITNLDNNSGPVRTLLTAFHEKLDVIEHITNSNVPVFDNLNILKESLRKENESIKQQISDLDIQEKTVPEVVNVTVIDTNESTENQYLEVTKPLTNNWCIQATDDNKEDIINWLGINTNIKIGCYYGINKSGGKTYNNLMQGWSSTFDEQITTEQFVKYIVGNNTAHEEVEYAEETDNFDEDDNLYVSEYKEEEPSIIKRMFSESDESFLARQTKNTKKEIWKLVKETNGIYAFSNKGQLKKVSTDKILKEHYPGTFYVTVNKVSKTLHVNKLQEKYFGN